MDVLPTEVTVSDGYRALVIEDDVDVRNLLVEVLGQAGFSVSATASGVKALKLMQDSPADLVTLDLTLPDMDGVEVCRRLREFSDAYLIMLTGRDEEIDRLVGLELGADDYMCKPFSVREFRARVAALFRRPRTTTGS